MKFTKAILLAAAIMASACNDDDSNDKKSNLESVKFRLSESTLIEAPDGLQTSDNDYAKLANIWILTANGLSQYVHFLQVPAGATKSTTRITAANGRTETSGDVLVYTWSDDQIEMKIAYQISEENDHYVFEIFLNEGGTDWLKYFHAEEKKDGSGGTMKVYDVEGENPSSIQIKYAWAYEDDGDFTLSFADYLGEASVAFIIGSNGSGVVTAYNGYESNSSKVYQILWDAEGDGSWMYFDEEGVVTDSGSWEA